MRRTAAPALRALMVRTGNGPLRPIWALAHRVAQAAIFRILLRGHAGGVAYLRGSFATGGVRYGYSDLDLAVVLPDATEPDAARRSVRRRWERLVRAMPPLGALVDLAVYERAELAEVAACSTLRARRPVHLAPRPPADEASLRLRPGLYGPLCDWRALGRGHPLSEVPAPDCAARRDAAWLELQFLWRWVFGACANPGAPDFPYLAVKLAADPIRIWLWLVHGERVAGRREALEAGLRRLPDEREALEEALLLDSRLETPSDAGFARMLPFLVRTSVRLAAQVTRDAYRHGAVQVRLVGGDAPELALRAGAEAPLRRLVGPEARLLPLADWRSRAWPLFPDEAFAVADLDAGDPEALGAAARAAGDYGPFAAIWQEDLMILPGPGLLRAVQCPMSDPVSPALASGSATAAFARVPGWSAADSARRAVLEHRAWLGSWRDGSQAALAEWMAAQGRTTLPTVQTLGRLLSAIQAALFFESSEAGTPALAVTMAAAARGLTDPGSRAVAEEAHAEYRRCRIERGTPRARLIAELREVVLAQPAYGFEAPARAARAAAGILP